jgi:hypothetical protein
MKRLVLDIDKEIERCGECFYYNEGFDAYSAKYEDCAHPDFHWISHKLLKDPLRWENGFEQGGIHKHCPLEDAK